MVNPGEVSNQVQSAYNNATADVNGGPEAAAGLLLAHHVAQSVALEIVALIESIPDGQEIDSVLEGIKNWCRNEKLARPLFCLQGHPNCKILLHYS